MKTKREFYTRLGNAWNTTKKYNNVVYCEICKEWKPLEHTHVKEVNTK